VRIAAVGKYVGHDDAYKSINEAFVHAGIVNDCKVRVTWVDSEQLEKGKWTRRWRWLITTASWWGRLWLARY
jgi:CTP synthase (UTP-ammonia lyase)